RIGGRIAQPDRQGGQPALITRTPDGGAFGGGEKFLLSPLEQRPQVTVRQPMARQKICLTGGLSIFAPRAGRLAAIATEYPVTHGLSKLFGYGSGVFDRQIGDTAAGIKDVRLGKRVRGADFEAGGTVAAAIGLPGVVHRQREKGKQLPEKKPAAGLA